MHRSISIYWRNGYSFCKNTNITKQNRSNRLCRSGDVAWYSAILEDLGEWDGKPIVSKDIRWTGVLEKRERKWVIVQMHASLPVKRVLTEAKAGEKNQVR